MGDLRPFSYAPFLIGLLSRGLSRERIGIRILDRGLGRCARLLLCPFRPRVVVVVLGSFFGGRVCSGRGLGGVLHGLRV